jgi:hypothetical protein
MTRTYLASEWCQREREWFENEIRRRGGGIENVFVVRAMPTDNEGWPDFLKDGFGQTVLGYPFCNEAQGRAARPFGWVTPLTSDPKFYEALTKLASDMALRLDEIRKAKHITLATQNNSRVRAQSKITDGPIFVAPGTEDVRPFVREIRTHLEGKGCMLLPPKVVKLEEFTEQDEDQALHIARAFVQCIGLFAAKEDGADIGRVQLLNQHACQQAIPRFLWRNSSIPLNALDYDQTYKQFVEGLGDIPERTPSVLADEVIQHLRQQGAERRTDQPLVAFIEFPAVALSEFDRLRNGIRTEDCLLLPLKPPVRGRISQIQHERKLRQLIYRDCNAVLLMYCIANQLNWLKDAIVNYLKDTTPVMREHNRAPVPVVIDYIGEAEALANTMGVDVITWNEGSDPNTLWQQLRSIAP